MHPTFKANSYARRGSPDPAVEIPDLSGSRYANVIGDLRDPCAGSGDPRTAGWSIFRLDRVDSHIHVNDHAGILVRLTKILYRLITISRPRQAVYAGIVLQLKEGRRDLTKRNVKAFAVVNPNYS